MRYRKWEYTFPAFFQRNSWLSHIHNSKISTGLPTVLNNVNTRLRETLSMAISKKRLEIAVFILRSTTSKRHSKSASSIMFGALRFHLMRLIKNTYFIIIFNVIYTPHSSTDLNRRAAARLCQVYILFVSMLLPLRWVRVLFLHEIKRILLTARCARYFTTDRLPAYLRLSLTARPSLFRLPFPHLPVSLIHSSIH